MIDLECPRCGYTTSIRCNMKKDFMRKQLCEALRSDVSREQLLDSISIGKQDAKRFMCLDCGAKFTSQPALSRHKNHFCKQCFPPNAEDKKRIETLERLNQEMKEQLNKLIASGGGGGQTNITNYNNTTNTCINVQINRFGSEDLEYLTRDKAFLDSCLKRREHGLIDYLRKSHFDPNHPQNHNVKVTNINRPWIDMYDGTRWIKAERDEVLDELLDEGCNQIDEHYEDTKGELAEKFTDNMVHLIESFVDKVKDRDTHMQIFQTLKRKIYLMMVNESKKMKPPIPA